MEFHNKVSTTYLSLFIVETYRYKSPRTNQRVFEEDPCIVAKNYLEIVAINGCSYEVWTYRRGVDDQSQWSLSYFREGVI